MSSSDASPYEAIEKGNLYSANYRIFFSKPTFFGFLFVCLEGPSGLISPWHDIPMFANEQDKIFNMVVEIPRWSNAKMEV